VSTSLFVARGRPKDVRDVIAAVGEYRLGIADGDISELEGPWPDGPLLLYVSNESARGVEVTFDKGFSLRLLALSSFGDYWLAFRLAEVLGGNAIVDVEGGDATRADELKKKLIDEWMARDMVVGATALAEQLREGNTVSIQGPLVAVELAPAVLSKAEPEALGELVRLAQARHARELDDDEEREAVSEMIRSMVLGVVIDGDHVEAFHGTADGAVMAVLDSGPSELASRAKDTLPFAKGVHYETLAAGFVADLDRRELRIFASESRMREGALRRPNPNLDQWSDFAVSRHDDVKDLAGHLGERGFALPPFQFGSRPYAWDELEHELSIGEQEHDAFLALEEKRAPPKAAEPAPSKGKGDYVGLVLFVLLFLTVGLPALVARLVTIPFRERWREEGRVRGEIARNKRRDAVTDATERLRAAPDDVDARFRRASELDALGRSTAADRDLCECLQRLDSGAKATVTRKAVLGLRQSTRGRYRNLAARDREEAGETGRVERVSFMRWFPKAVKDIFLDVGGFRPS